MTIASGTCELRLGRDDAGATAAFQQPLLGTQLSACTQRFPARSTAPTPHLLCSGPTDCGMPSLVGDICCESMGRMKGKRLCRVVAARARLRRHLQQ